MIRTLFPTFVYQCSVTPARSALLQDLRAESLRLREVDEKGLAWSKKNYPEGFTSYGSMAELHRFSSTFDSLRRKIDPHVSRYVKHLGLDVSKRALRMSSCWVNIMPRHSTHSGHLHPLSVVSGTFYVQTPPGGGGLKFEDPRLPQFMGRPPVRGSARGRALFHEMKPRAGELILFESWLRHEVPPNRGGDERISVSFNYDWVSR